MAIKYVIKRGEKYVTRDGCGYTTKIENACLFIRKRDALKNSCKDEKVVKVDVQVTEIPS